MLVGWEMSKMKNKRYLKNINYINKTICEKEVIKRLGGADKSHAHIPSDMNRSITYLYYLKLYS